MQKNHVRIFILLSCGLAMVWLAASAARYFTAHVPTTVASMQDTGGAGGNFPLLALSNLGGQTVDIFSLYPGKFLLVNYWATWCPPCLAEIPSLLKLQETARAQNVEVVLISLDFPESPEKLKKLLARYKLDHVDTLYMVDTTQWPLIGGQGLPITVLVSPERKIISRMSGAIDWAGSDGQDFIRPALAASK